jgi:hypothetical protein
MKNSKVRPQPSSGTADFDTRGNRSPTTQTCYSLKKASSKGFSTTGVSISELPFKVAQLKGFWREEGLDVEAILIRGAVGMQALLGGSVDYTSAYGSTIAAAVGGLPVKLVFISSSKPQFELVSQPQIKSVQELKGKVVGISSLGGSNDLMMDFELPQPDKSSENPWRRWIDTALDSPHDIVQWETAESVPGYAYRIPARSVVVLFCGS